MLSVNRSCKQISLMEERQLKGIPQPQELECYGSCLISRHGKCYTNQRKLIRTLALENAIKIQKYKENPTVSNL